MALQNQNAKNLFPPGKLLTGDEIATMLNISRSFAYQLMSSGEIPVVRLGRAVRVRPEDLDFYLQSNLEQ